VRRSRSHRHRLPFCSVTGRPFDKAAGRRCRSRRHRRRRQRRAARCGRAPRREPDLWRSAGADVLDPPAGLRRAAPRVRVDRAIPIGPPADRRDRMRAGATRRRTWPRAMPGRSSSRASRTRRCSRIWRSFSAIERSTNVRLWRGDAFDLLDRLGSAVVAELRIWFPDPWPKPPPCREAVGHSAAAGRARRRTRRRRSAAPCHRRTGVREGSAVGGPRQTPRLTGGVVPRPTERPITKFEARGLKEGREAVDIEARRIG